MTSKETSRERQTLAVALAAALFVAFGQWALGGITGAGMFVSICGLAFNLLAVAMAPFVYGWQSRSRPRLLAAGLLALSILLGCLVFGLWGLAFLGIAVILFLVISAL